MKVFKTKFLPANTLAIPSLDNYRRQIKHYLDVSIQWQEWVSHCENTVIQYAVNLGEEKPGAVLYRRVPEVNGVKSVGVSRVFS